MKLRLAEKPDIPQLVRMRWDFTAETHSVREPDYPDFEEVCGRFLDHALEGNQWFVWVAEQNGEIVSHIYLELVHKVPRPGRPTNPFVYMTNVYSKPGYRGTGIGGKLLRTIEGWARDRSYEFIIVWPSETSVGFYGRNGYRTCAEPMELSLE